MKLFDKCIIIFKKCFPYILLIIVCLLWLRQCNINDINKDISKHNIEALTDSLESIKLKNGDLMSMNKSLITDKENINKILDMSTKEFKDIERKLKSDIARLAETKAKIEYDTIYMNDSIIIHNDSSWTNYFNYSDKFTKLNGEISYINKNISTKLTNISIDAPLTLGFTEDNKVFATSTNPNIKFSSINSVVLDKYKKHKRWSLGIYLGFGVQYGILNNSLDLGPQLGIGLNYRIW